MGLARIQAAVLERMPGQMLTRDQLLLLARDNVASPELPGLVELGVVPTPVELVVPRYLRRFRPGGGKREILPEEMKEPGSDLFPRAQAAEAT
jgi:NADH dehydrogenase